MKHLNNGLLTSEAMLTKLREACETEGSQKAWAKKHGVCHQYVCDILGGRRDIGPSILTALGYKRVVLFEKLGKQTEEGFDERASVVTCGSCGHTKQVRRVKALGGTS